MDSTIKLSNREQNIVLATIRLWNVNLKTGFVPDYELVEKCFELSPNDMSQIRDLVQEVHPRKIS